MNDFVVTSEKHGIDPCSACDRYGYPCLNAKRQYEECFQCLYPHICDDCISKVLCDVCKYSNGDFCDKCTNMLDEMLKVIESGQSSCPSCKPSYFTCGTCIFTHPSN